MRARLGAERSVSHIGQLSVRLKGRYRELVVFNVPKPQPVPSQAMRHVVAGSARQWILRQHFAICRVELE